MRGTLWRRLDMLHQKHGTIVRIAPNELSISSPGAWADIYTSRPLLIKEPSSQTPPLNGAHSLFTAVGEHHQRLRGVLAQGFSDKTLRQQAPLIEHYATELIARLRRELEDADTPVLDLQRFFGYAALDTITHLSYGESLDGLSSRNEHDWMTRFFMHGRFSTIRMCLCWLSPLDTILDTVVLSMTRKQRAQNWAFFSSKIERQLAKGEDPTGQRCDLITPLIGKVVDDRSTEVRKPGSITKKELFSHSLASVVANSQLTTVALTTCTYLLLSHPRTLQRLVAELRNTFNSDKDITVQSTQSMPYLGAVLDESMRLRHPTPITLPRVVPPQGRVVDGTFIPGNTIVGINLHVIQTSPLYWVDPHSFYPERFLPPTDARYDARFDKDVKRAFMPFSTGPRNCIGSRLYLAEARITLAKLFWNFDISLPGQQQKDWLDQRAFLVWEPKSLHVSFVVHEK
ncbi:cytochrome P450 monooxygenase-like protein [Melanomma pulvis-pyrius CBS 109.77]|uniref:Cytochrome P450 monooxygenase-like protein n=1 Tax=Melanomma pulvis-pyrius CBS 109.77 TaxID=1314802 RepID=A0A6A6X6X2_9PLEO|nr:cytochrome P450 monooxygenase-like protein [Melanomma pulvis-pyrius CBS 109.77]